MRLRRGAISGAGARDLHVTIETRPDDDDGGSGFPDDGDWTPLAVVPMARSVVEAVETARGTQTVALNTSRWEMPWQPDMDPDTVDVPKLRRLNYLGRTYDILAATPIGRHRTIELIASATSKIPTTEDA